MIDKIDKFTPYSLVEVGRAKLGDVVRGRANKSAGYLEEGLLHSEAGQQN